MNLHLDKEWKSGEALSVVIKHISMDSPGDWRSGCSPISRQSDLLNKVCRVWIWFILLTFGVWDLAVWTNLTNTDNSITGWAPPQSHSFPLSEIQQEQLAWGEVFFWPLTIGGNLGDYVFLSDHWRIMECISKCFIPWPKKFFHL